MPGNTGIKASWITTYSIPVKVNSRVLVTLRDPICRNNLSFMHARWAGRVKSSPTKR